MKTICYFAKLAKGIRHYFVLAVLFVIIETSFEVAIPFLMSDIIDEGIAQQDSSIFIEKGFWMLLCAFLSLIFGLLYAKVAAKGISLFCEKLRNKQYFKMQEFAFQNLDHFESSSLITRLSSDVNVIQNALSNGIRPFARGPVILILGLIMSLWINKKLSIIFFGTLPILGIVLFWVVKKISPMYAKMQKAMDSLNQLIQENLIAIRAVKAFVRDEYEEAQFASVNNNQALITQNTFRIASLNTPAFQFTMYLSILALMTLGIQMIFAQEMKVGELTGILSYVLQIMNSLVLISNVFLLISRSMASCLRIQEILEEPIAMESHSLHLSPKDASIQFCSVAFKYDKKAPKYVLSDISFTIPEGSTFGIIGSTGSAKSSLVQLIPRLYDVTEGKILIGKVDVRDIDLTKLRDMVGIVLQNNTLFSGTVLENLRWGNPNATLEEAQEACKIANADSFVQDLTNGYNTHIEQGGANLSGGQRQRLCLARALLKKPKIMILDDATSAIDTNTDLAIRKALKEQTDMTQIIISQRVSSLSYCDQILVLEDGKILDIGNHDQLMERCSFYQSIVSQQQKGATHE